MGFFGKGKETYVYLNGVRPREEASLGDGVVLLPASCRPSPEYIIKGIDEIKAEVKAKK